MTDAPADLRSLFGQMLRNAQVLERLLLHAGVALEEPELALWTNTLQHLSALTETQTRTLHAETVRAGGERRSGERRVGSERRWGL